MSSVSDTSETWAVSVQPKEPHGLAAKFHVDRPDVSNSFETIFHLLSKLDP